jgi:hypothetical protein
MSHDQVVNVTRRQAIQGLESKQQNFKINVYAVGGLATSANPAKLV